MSTSVTATVSRKYTNRQSLTEGYDYVVIGIDEDNYRIIDDVGEPSLYPKTFFVLAEIIVPKEWVFRDYGDGCFSFDPPELSKRRFYEDYHDRVQEAIEKYEQYRQQLGAGTLAANVDAKTNIFPDAVAPMVTCLVTKKHGDRQSLAQGHDYFVIGIDEDNYRIIDDVGEPELYPKEFFVDKEIVPPRSWVIIGWAVSGFRCEPSELSNRGFYEEYQDGIQEAIDIYKEFKKKIGISD